MFRKLGIIVTVIIIIVVCIYVYSNKNGTPQQIQPVSTMKTISGITYIESGMTQSGNNWDPNVMRVGKPIQAGSGVTVTVSTNGPPVRAMTPEELREFQKKIQGK